MHRNHNVLKTLGRQAATLVMALHERGRARFTLEDVAAITGLREASARSFARKLVGRGVAARVNVSPEERRGVVRT